MVKKLFFVFVPLILSAHAGTAQVMQQDSLALVAFYNATGGDHWTNNTNWLKPGQPVSAWYGVTLTGDQKRVRTLVLGSNNLEGVLPDEIGNLSSLYTLILFDGHLSGNIPDSYRTLDRLLFLDLSDQELSGYIPSFLFKMPRGPGIHAFDLLLANNNFIGISPWDGDHQNMFDLTLEGNNLAFGEIEPFVANRKSISFLSYGPQDAVYTSDELTVWVGAQLTLKSSVSGSANHYQWFKDGMPVSNAAQSSYDFRVTNKSYEGSYTSEITNDIVTDLTLQRNPIKISVDKDTVYTSCDGSPLLLNASVADVQATYSWSTGETTATINVPTSGKYGVRVETSNYILKDTIEVIVLPKLSLGPDVDTCDRAVTLSSNVNAESYTWQTPDGPHDQRSIIVNKDGQYLLEIRAGACVQRDTVHVRVNRFTEGSFDIRAGSIIIPDNGIVMVDGGLSLSNTTGTGTDFNWTFGDGNTSLDDKPGYVYNSPGVYTITLNGADNRNCPITVSKTVHAQNLVITNAISPNGDGKNDKLYIEPFLYSAELKVINRWGQEVYYSSYYADDFTASGLEGGVYYYELYFKEIDKGYKGNVHVLK